MLKTFINFFYTHSSYSFWYSSARIRKRQLTFVHTFVTSCIHASEKKCFKHIQLTSRIYHTEVSRFTHIRAQPMPNITYMFISKFLFIHFQPITHNLYTLIWQTFYCAHLTSNFHTFEWTTTYSSDNLHQLSTYTFSSNSLLNTLNWKKKKKTHSNDKPSFANIIIGDCGLAILIVNTGFAYIQRLFSLCAHRLM